MKRDRAFFFVAYEGYRQRSVVAMNATVPTPRFRDILTTSLPFPETQLWLKFYPTPNQPLTAPAEPRSFRTTPRHYRFRANSPARA